MRRIVHEGWPVKYPPYMSPAAKDLIARLLERKPTKRIGMLNGRAGDIKNHPWFQVRRVHGWSPRSVGAYLHKPGPCNWLPHSAATGMMYVSDGGPGMRFCFFCRHGEVAPCSC
jgi:hypothetical protein